MDYRTIGPYKIIYMLGSGGFGTVYLVENNDRRYALKQLEIGVMNPEISKRFFLESKKIEKLRERYHLQYIIQVIEVLHEQNAYVMEYIPGDVEEHFANRIDEEYIFYLIRALHQLHQLNVVHRDIKPKNLRIKNNLPIIIDFGVTSWWDSRSKLSQMGTKFYSPPEVVVNVFSEYNNLAAARKANALLIKIKPDNAMERFKYIKKLHDVYSLGITVGELLTGSHPFSMKGYPEYLEEGYSAEFTAWLERIPLRFREFIEKATTFSPLDRPQLDDLLQVLKLQPFDFLQPIAGLADDTYSPDSYYRCLRCHQETLPPAYTCPRCGEALRSLMLHIEPLQDIKISDSPPGLQLIRNPGIEDSALSIFIDLESPDFKVMLGRSSNNSQIAFRSDNWMSKVHGRLIKEKDKLFYIDGADGQQPTNPGQFNNLPVGNSRVELTSGSLLLLGSTVLKVKKYFGTLSDLGIRAE